MDYVFHLLETKVFLHSTKYEIGYKQINFLLCCYKSKQLELSQQQSQELPKLSKLDCVPVELWTGNAILPKVYR